MTRDDVINTIINSNLIEKLSNTFVSRLGVNKEDFIQEMYLILLEIPEERLVKLYTEGSLNFYLLSVARNQVVNDKSTFNKKYNSKIIEYVYDYPIEESDDDCSERSEI